MNNRRRQKIGQKKFTDNEVWNIGFVLARQIHKGLVQFKHADRVGVPAEFEGNEQGWEDVLDKMIWGFNEVANDYPSSPIALKFDDFHRKNPNYVLKSVKEEHGYRVIFDDYVQLTDDDYEEDKLYHKEVEECLTLFVKYIATLWD